MGFEPTTTGHNPAYNQYKSITYYNKITYAVVSLH